MHILPEDIPGKVSLRPARQLKRGQTLLKANWRPTIFLAPYSSNIQLHLSSETEMYSIAEYATCKRTKVTLTGYITKLQKVKFIQVTNVRLNITYR